MDEGLRIAIFDIFEELRQKYGLDYRERQDRMCAIIFVHRYISSLMPVRMPAVNKKVMIAMGMAVGLKSRMVRYIADEGAVHYRKIKYITKDWKVSYFDEGTTHRVRSLEWYMASRLYLKRIGLLNTFFRWKNKHCSDRIAYVNKTVCITKREGTKIRIAQDGGLNEWTILELMGEVVVNDKQED